MHNTYTSTSWLILMQVFDSVAIKKGFNKTALLCDNHADLSVLVAENLMTRLGAIKFSPATILNIGASTGAMSALLATVYPHAHITNLDIASLRLSVAAQKLSSQNFICADAQALPFQDQSFDLVISNLCFHWMEDVGQALAEARRVLKRSGNLLFSMLGSDTLYELKSAFLKVSAAAHVNYFFDMHDVGDALLRVGFADPVMDVEHEVLYFEKLSALFEHLRYSGEKNYLHQRSRHVSSKKMIMALTDHYQKFHNIHGYPATFEIIFGYAWRKDEPSSSYANGEISVPISKIGYARTNR